VVTEDQFVEKMEVAYPKAEEDLIDFLNRCKISNTNAMLYPRCSAVFDKEAAKSAKDSYHIENEKEDGLRTAQNSVSTREVSHTK